MTTGIGTLSDLLPQQGGGGRIYGVVVGVVTDVNDVKGLNRVKVKFPWLPNGPLGVPIEGPWARVVTPMAGNGRGLWLLPQVDDEVAVMFEHGDPNHPYVIGALWNGQDKPPVAAGSPPPQMAVLKSKSGHTITLDDTNGAEKITVVDKTGKNQIVIDSTQSTVAITGAQGLTITATQGNIGLAASAGDVTVSCNNFNVTAQQAYSIAGNTTGEVKANAGLKVTCMAGVSINNDALKVM